MRNGILTIIAVMTLAMSTSAYAQQVADPNADVSVSDPAFAKNAGPAVLIDSGHGEFQTIASGYAPFAALLANDGYRVADFHDALTAQNLARTKVLVIADARNKADPRGTPPADSTSAFTSEEIATLHDWVVAGGALLIVSDHPPFVGSVSALAEAFGFRLYRYAARPTDGGLELFTPANGGLAAGPLTAGVDQIQTFFGGSFRAGGGAVPLMRLGPSWTLLGPTPAPATADDLRGAAVTVGAGRVVMLSEAGELSAQISNKRAPMGFNAPDAAGNRRFVRNVIHWLAVGDSPAPPAAPASPAP